MILSIILLVALSLTGFVVFSRYVSGATNKELVVWLGVGITVFLFGPLAIYIGLADILKIEVMPMFVRQFILMPIFLVVALATSIVVATSETN